MKKLQKLFLSLILTLMCFFALVSCAQKPQPLDYDAIDKATRKTLQIGYILDNFQSLSYLQSDFISRESATASFFRNDIGEIIRNDEYTRSYSVLTMPYQGYICDYGSQYFAVAACNNLLGYTNDYFLMSGVDFKSAKVLIGGNYSVVYSYGITAENVENFSSWNATVGDFIYYYLTITSDLKQTIKMDCVLYATKTGIETPITAATLLYGKAPLYSKTVKDLLDKKDTVKITINFDDETTREFNIFKNISNVEFYCDEGYALYPSKESEQQYAYPESGITENLSLYCKKIPTVL